MAIRSDVQVNWWTSPRIITVLAPSLEITIQDLVDTCRWLEEQFPNMAYPHLINAAGKDALGGGVLVGITATLQNAVLQFEGRTCQLTSGTVTENDARGITLTAAGSPNGDFVTLGVERGMTVFNATTGNMGTIISIESEDQLTSQPLKGCSTGPWTIGDTYVIYDNVVANITGGNLVAVDENDINIDPVFQAPNVNIVRTSSSSATLSDLENIQASAYQGEVALDVISGKAGTAFPLGTHEYPSNNLRDAKIIGRERGLETISVRGSLTVSASDNLEGFRIRGEGTTKTQIILLPGCAVNKAEFINLYLTGESDGTSLIVRECVINDFTHANGYFFQTALDGTFTPHTTGVLNILDSFSAIPGANHPHVDLAGCSGQLSFRGYNGGLGFSNADSGLDMTVDMASGTVHIHNTCTAGNFFIRGVTNFVDDTVGGSPRPFIDSTGVVNPTTNAAATWNYQSNAPGSPIKTYGEILDYLQANNISAGDVWNVLSNAPGSPERTFGEVIVDIDQAGSTNTSTINNIQTTVDSIESKIDIMQLDVTDIVAVTTTILKYHKNRTLIDETAYTLTVFDDDKVTPIAIFDLKDEVGTASITSIFERIPVGSP